MTLPTPAVAAVILAGGQGRRLGGVDKAALVVGGVTLLDRLLSALASLAPAVVVVGESRPTVLPVLWTREEPAGGGPVAGLDAGLAALDPAFGDVVLVLATDLVRFGVADVQRLLTAMAHSPDADAVLFVDPDGRLQPLAGAYRVGGLRRALAGLGPVAGQSVRALIAPLRVVTVPDLGAAADCDTPAQLEAVRARTDEMQDGYGRSHGGT